METCMQCIRQRAVSRSRPLLSLLFCDLPLHVASLAPLPLQHRRDEPGRESEGAAQQALRCLPARGDSVAWRGSALHGSVARATMSLITVILRGSFAALALPLSSATRAFAFFLSQPKTAELLKREREREAETRGAFQWISLGICPVCLSLLILSLPLLLPLSLYHESVERRSAAHCCGVRLRRDDHPHGSAGQHPH